MIVTSCECLIAEQRIERDCQSSDWAGSLNVREGGGGGSGVKYWI